MSATVSVGHSLEDCPVHIYATQVLAGEIVTGELVRLACERHMRDIEQAEEKGFFLDHKAEAYVLGLFEYLPHTKGEFAGKPFDLSLFGLTPGHA